MTDQVPGSAIALGYQQFREKLSGKDGRNTSLAGVERRRDGRRTPRVSIDQILQMFPGEQRLVADENQDTRGLAVEWAGGCRTAAQRGTHPFTPLLVDDDLDRQPIQFDPNARGFVSQDGKDGRTPCLNREAGGAPQQRFSGNLNQLFGLAEARGGSGSEDDGGDSWFGFWVRSWVGR